MPRNNLKEQVSGAVGKALEKLLADEKRAAKVAQAVGAVQKGKDALGKAQQSVMRAFGVPSKGDYKDVSKRISSLKRRVRHVAERIEKK